MSDMYDILGRLYRLNEGLNANQKSADQLPALVKPKHISVINAPKDPAHPLDKYMVGEQQGVSREELLNLIVDQRPEWFTEYGTEAIVAAAEAQVAKGAGTINDMLLDMKQALSGGDYLGTGDLEESMNICRVCGQTPCNCTHVTEGEEVAAIPAKKDIHVDSVKHPKYGPLLWIKRDGQDYIAQKQADGTLKLARGYSTDAPELAHAWKQLKAQARQGAIAEGIAQEDIIGDKKSLGDYLQDLATMIKRDPDILDRNTANTDSLGPVVKTVKLDDGREIKIHGNEDDGFRISIKNKPSRSSFKSLDEAAMAVEMFCRRKQAVNTDYLDEK